MTIQRIPNDVIIAGDLTVGGSLPKRERSSLVQENLTVFPISLITGKVWDSLAALPAAGAADDLGLIAGTYGTDSPRFQTSDSKATSVTQYARFELIIPENYVAAETIQIRIAAGMDTTISDGTATVDLVARKVDRLGAVGADLVSTAAQNCNSLTVSDKTFVVDASGLSPGDKLDCRVAIAITDAATGTTVTGEIAAMDLQCDTKG